MMNIQSASNRLSLLGSFAMLLAAGVVGCTSPVESPDASVNPLEKGGKKGSTTTTSVWEAEPNNDPATASDVISTSTGGGRQGWISSATDNDYYLTQAVPAGQQLNVTISMPMNTNYDVQLLAADGTLVASGQQLGSSETIYHVNTTGTSQTYKIRVFSANGTYSATSPYTLVAGINS